MAANKHLCRDMSSTHAARWMLASGVWRLLVVRVSGSGMARHRDVAVTATK
jgi:hypothetical protein